MKRTYIAHRRAYFPRMWLQVTISASVSVAVNLALYVGLDVSPLISAVIGVICGVVTVDVRLRVWRRRHPPISPEEMLNDIREKAPWN